MPGAPGVIRLDLARATDMFETPSVTLGAGTGSSITGVDQCIAALTAERLRPPVHVEVLLPESEVTSDVAPNLTITLRRWCEEHSRHNDHQIRAMKRSGWRALRIGFPITLLGLLIVAAGGDMSQSDPIRDVVDILGWVLAWLGLWYPFDTVLFYPLDLVRENRALGALRDATLTVEGTPSTPASD